MFNSSGIHASTINPNFEPPLLYLDGLFVSRAPACCVSLGLQGLISHRFDYVTPTLYIYHSNTFVRFQGSNRDLVLFNFTLFDDKNEISCIANSVKWP